jgi:hypothetical protein
LSCGLASASDSKCKDRDSQHPSYSSPLPKEIKIFLKILNENQERDKMKFFVVAVTTYLAHVISPSKAFLPPSSCSVGRPSHLSTTAIYSTTDTSTATLAKKGIENLTVDIVAKLRFREVQRELEARQLDTSGTFTNMRQRLRHVATVSLDDESIRLPQKSDNVRVIDEESLNNVSVAHRTSGLIRSSSFFENLMDSFINVSE